MPILLVLDVRAEIARTLDLSPVEEGPTVSVVYTSLLAFLCAVLTKP